MVNRNRWTGILNHYINGGYYLATDDNQLFDLSVWEFLNLSSLPGLCSEYVEIIGKQIIDDYWPHIIAYDIRLAEVTPDEESAKETDQMHLPCPKAQLQELREWVMKEVHRQGVYSVEGIYIPPAYEIALKLIDESEQSYMRALRLINETRLSMEGKNGT